jgi:glucose-1-phosphate adenylyltransferase
VRKNLSHLLTHPFEYLLILSGDQLYQMDYREIVGYHVEHGADVTVATLPVVRRDVPGFGVMKLGQDLRITDFIEKPKERELQDRYKLPVEWYERLGLTSAEELWLASMGIYVFSRQALLDLVVEDDHDFGKHIIPEAIKSRKVVGYIFQGAWEDLGTIKAFFEANLDLASDLPRFNFYDFMMPTFTRARFLPPSKVNGATLESSILSEGCLVSQATIQQSIVGLRTVIGRNAHIRRTVIMGSDYYETQQAIADNAAAGRPRIGIGNNTRNEHAIIDKHVRIGENCVITPAANPDEVEHPHYYEREGIIIVPKNGCIPSGTKL